VSFEVSIILFGGGRMGSAMLRGWIASGIDPGAIHVMTPRPDEALLALAAECGIRVNPPLTARAGQVVVLAVKPQRVAEIADQIATIATPDTLIISVMAGKTMADLRTLLPGVPSFVRAMPNLLAAVGSGMTVAVADCSAAQRVLAERLLSSTGAFEWLHDEALMDAATGVSGSGPAYLFYIAVCLTSAGIAAGLPADVAERLARATVAGAGAMLAPDGPSAAQLRRDVTSPNGTTQAGLERLMADGVLMKLVEQTVAAAAMRARELAAA
jgi:pyrroline-5-carboxylate reductase